MGAIYRIWNNRNGKSYIGQSVRPASRVYRHLTGDGSRELAADLLKYDRTAWQWEILADKSDYLGVSLNELETRFIHQYESVKTGYNLNRGGGVPVTTPRYGQRRGYWDDERLNRRLRHEKILEAIDNYRCLQIHGMTSTVDQRQQEIISEYGSIEAYEQHMDRERSKAAGCFPWVVLIFILIVSLSSC